MLMEAKFHNAEMVLVVLLGLLTLKGLTNKKDIAVSTKG